MKKLLIFMLLSCILLSAFPISGMAAGISKDSIYAPYGLKIKITHSLLTHHYASWDEYLYMLYGVHIDGCVPALDATTEDQLKENGYIEYIIVIDEFYGMEKAIAALKARKDIVHMELLYPELTPQINIDDILPDYSYYGDTNGNRELDARDYLLLKRAFFGTYDLPDESVGDINCNGKLDARDYLLLKRAFFGTYSIGADN